MDPEETAAYNREIVFNTFVQRLIGPNKQSTYCNFLIMF